MQTLDQWGIPLKSKNAYTKTEIIELIRQFDLRFNEIEKVLQFERKKGLEYKEEARLINE